LLLGWVMISCHANSLMLSLDLSLFFTFFVFGLSFLLQLNCLRRIHIHYGEGHA